ncbi:OmpA family protein [Rubritalea squalenifaciens DSM 18772]|uniref:OmpA family protein n=1 Tax=Rubritalea squalenifaciens DSM 18772 TaxID=1123071 RepID=A0A1M6JAM4_9BACT|nr:OmpA family protein [Rubritalea squalenifaciens]SHJ43739.1 OmpA family protein [Rubritalea squalenifaciens DSM 18772]
MANHGYSWRNVKHGSSFSLPKSENFGRWVGVAIVLAILLHVLLFFGLKNMTIVMDSIGEMLEIQTEPVRVVNVDDSKMIPEAKMETVETPEVTGELLEEIEALEALPENTEIDMSPAIQEPDLTVKMEIPAMKGSDLAESLDPIAGPKFDESMSDLGRMDDIIQPAAVGQVVVDPGEMSADIYDPDKFNEEMEKKGANGLADKGALDKFTPLSTMANMSGNALENATGMIGSDLLFDYNKATLRESARNSLLKVALLIDKNPKLNCWIGGHTDLIGGDDFNYELSVKRAQAVKDWLVTAMRIEPERLIVIGYGENQPLVSEGDENAQALNRRVEIKMRRGLPQDGESQVVKKAVEQEPKPKVEEEAPKENPPKAILVKPNGPPNIKPPAKAIPAEPDPGKAIPVEPGRAVIEPETPRAVPVE